MYKLAPATPDRLSPLLLPDKDTSITREAEQAHALGLPLGLGAKGLRVLRVKTGHFTVNVSVAMPKRADRLVVTFADARFEIEPVTAQRRRPYFTRRKWTQAFRGAVLAISDPQVEGPTPVAGARSGLYLGTFAHDLVPELLALIDQVCDELRIPRDRVVLYGAGAGGFTAMLVGSRRTSRTGIVAVNPLLRPEKLGESLVQSVVRAAEGTLEDWDRMRSDPGLTRNNPLIAVRDSILEGRDLKLVALQNLRDTATIHRHFPGLWRRFEMDAAGGVAPNGRVMILTYEDRDARGSEEPSAFTLPLFERACEFFDKPVETTDVKPAIAARAARAEPAASPTPAAASGSDFELDDDDDRDEDEDADEAAGGDDKGARKAAKLAAKKAGKAAKAPDAASAKPDDPEAAARKAAKLAEREAGKAAKQADKQAAKASKLAEREAGKAAKQAALKEKKAAKAASSIED